MTELEILTPRVEWAGQFVCHACCNDALIALSPDGQFLCITCADHLHVHVNHGKVTLAESHGVRH